MNRADFPSSSSLRRRPYVVLFVVLLVAASLGLTDHPAAGGTVPAPPLVNEVTVVNRIQFVPRGRPPTRPE